MSCIADWGEGIFACLAVFVAPDLRGAFLVAVMGRSNGCGESGWEMQLVVHDCNYGFKKRFCLL
jgi:hypothetical protein